MRKKDGKKYFIQVAFSVQNEKAYERDEATDLRKGVSGLLAIIENDMHLNALDESVFLFCNKSHKLLKLIFWDKTGFWLAQKRLGSGEGARSSYWILTMIETAKIHNISLF